MAASVSVVCGCLVLFLRQRRALYHVAGTLLRAAQPAVADGLFDGGEALHFAEFQRLGQCRERSKRGNGHQPLNTIRQPWIALQRAHLFTLSSLQANDQLAAHSQQGTQLSINIPVGRWQLAKAAGLVQTLFVVAHARLH